jgi:hypothetical protein
VVSRGAWYARVRQRFIGRASEPHRFPSLIRSTSASTILVGVMRPGAVRVEAWPAIAAAVSSFQPDLRKAVIPEAGRHGYVEAEIGLGAAGRTPRRGG